MTFDEDRRGQQRQIVLLFSLSSKVYPPSLCFSDPNLRSPGWQRECCMSIEAGSHLIRSFQLL